MLNFFKKPKVSIIMAVYNTASYLDESIWSILNQTFSDFEFIIIDDWSVDNSSEIITKYQKKDNRITFLQNWVNLWISKTRNKWLKIAKWDFVASFDSDDVAESIWLETQLNFLTNNLEYALCWACINFITRSSKIVQKLNYPEKDKDIKDTLYYVNPFVHSTVLIRKSCFDEVWFFNENLKNAEDLDLWFRFAGAWYLFHNTQQYLVNYRIHWTNSIITQRNEMVANTFRLLKSNNIFSKISFNFNALSFFVASFFKYSYVIFFIKFIK